jgi:hypothetical protein
MASRINLAVETLPATSRETRGVRQRHSKLRLQTTSCKLQNQTLQATSLQDKSYFVVLLAIVVFVPLSDAANDPACQGSK